MNTQGRENLQLEFWNNVLLRVCWFICILVILKLTFDKMVLGYVEGLFIFLSQWHFFPMKLKNNFPAMEEKETVSTYTFACSSSLSRGWAWQPVPRGHLDKAELGHQKTVTRRYQVSCPPHHPLHPAAWNPNVCPCLHWWVGSRLWQQSPPELAASLRTQERESKVEPGTKTQSNGQDACAAGQRLWATVDSLSCRLPVAPCSFEFLLSQITLQSPWNLWLWESLWGVRKV